MRRDTPFFRPEIYLSVEIKELQRRNKSALANNLFRVTKAYIDLHTHMAI